MKLKAKPVTSAIEDATKGKREFRLSTISTERYREPVNPEMAKRMTQFVVDYSQQKPVVPYGIPNAFTHGARSPHTTNHNGRSKVFGALDTVFLGGSPDMPGKF